MRSSPKRAAAVLVGLSVTATALQAGAQGAPEPEPQRAPLQVAVAPTVPPPAASTLSDPEAGVLVAFVVGLGLADAAFGVYDGVKAARAQRPATGVAIAESVFTAPQVVAFATVHAIFSHDTPDDRDGLLAGLVLLPGITSSLFVHGVWSSEAPAARPGVLYGVPWAVGFDATFTLSAISAGANGRLFGRPLGAVEMALTAPQIAAASYGIVKDPRNVAGWAPLTAWSSALFVHGLLSVVLPRRESKEEPPPPPVAPVPDPAPAPKPPLLVPGSIEVGPAPMAGGGGVSVRGRWW